jgi:hypothetical protein
MKPKLKTKKAPNKITFPIIQHSNALHPWLSKPNIILDSLEEDTRRHGFVIEDSCV